MEAVFIKALNMSISAGWLILAVMLLRLFLKKAPKWISVLLWGLVGLRLVLPFSLQSVFSLIPSAEVISPSIGYAQHPAINSGVSIIDNAVNPMLGTSLAATPMNSVNPMQIVLYLGGLVWVGGIAILLLYGLISYLQLRHKVAEAIPYVKNTWLCDQVKTPFILGVFRPRIYLPSGLSEEETAYVLAHEHAHLRRKDHLWKPLGFLFLTVYWFNPLVWVAYILLCRDIEAACDEKVISDMAMTEKKAYANALVSCSMQRRLILACPLAFGEVGVKERVKGVLNYKKPAFWIIVAALFACVVIAVCFLTNPKDDSPDLSFLNYKNAISLIGQNDTAPYANLYPADSDGVQPGVADAKALAQFLSGSEWTQRRAPSSSPEPRGYLEFVIENDYRIIVYQSERLAAVRFGNDIRYYRTGAGDYEAALASFIPAPSTEPDRLSEMLFGAEQNGEFDFSISTIGGVDDPGSVSIDIRIDVCELYLKVLEDLWNVDPGLNDGISQIGFDLSALSHLTELEKETVMHEFASKHNLSYIAGTWEEICEQGYIDKDNLYWEDGLFFSIKTNEDVEWNLPATKDGDSVPELTSFDAQKWRSGLGAYFFSQCTAQKNADGKWSYTVGQEAIS